MKPKTGDFADKFGIVITPYKVFYDPGMNGDKAAKEHVLTGSKCGTQVNIMQ